VLEKFENLMIVIAGRGKRHFIHLLCTYLCLVAFAKFSFDKSFSMYRWDFFLLFSLRVGGEVSINDNDCALSIWHLWACQTYHYDCAVH